MGDSKALLAHGKALPACGVGLYDQAMLSTAATVADKLRLALREAGVTQTQVAQYCGVTKQAVQGWIKTGRIDKQRLPKLAEITGRPLSWWLDGKEAESTAHLTMESAKEYSISEWPFESITPGEYNRLTSRQRALVEGYVRGLLAQPTADKSDRVSNGA